MRKPTERFPYLNAEEYRRWWAENTNIPYGYCWCGCGNQTTIARYDHSAKGAIRGEPRRYLPHHVNMLRGDKHFLWRGGNSAEGHGYIDCHAPWHPFANQRGYVRRHRLVMEDMLHRFLWPWEIVHHVNGDRADNRPDNLQLMDKREHDAMHNRKRYGTPYTVEQLVAMRRSGMTYVAIANHFNRNHGHIRKQIVEAIGPHKRSDHESIS